MSAKEDFRSFQCDSEEFFEHVCNPCLYRGIQKKATNFCNDCQEMLCQNCTDSHKGLKISRTHKILPIGEVSFRAISEPSSGCRVLCECNQNLEVAIYCPDHDEVSCQACSIIKHRRCKTVSVNEQSASYSTAKLSALDQRANKLHAEIDEIVNKTKYTLKASTSQMEKVKTDIRDFRKEINRQLDLMDQNILEKLDKGNLVNQQEAERHISSCTTTKHMLETDLKLLNDVATSGSKVDMFAADVNISKRLREYKCLLQDVCQESKLQSLTFQKNQQLVELLKTIDSIGTLTGEAVFLTRSTRKPFSDLKIERTNKVNVKLPDDKRVPAITGCVFLPDGQAVLCDSENSKLKMLSKLFTLQGSLILSAYPFDLAVVNNSTVIATLPQILQLQYIQVVPRLIPGRVLQLDRKCFGVEVAGGDIYVTCVTGANSGREGEVMILDQDGNVKRRIGVNQDGTFMFVIPWYLAVNIKSNKIYVSDYGKQTVTVLRSDGTVVYQYEDPDTRLPRGMCFGDDDNILICCEGSNTVQIVTATGQKGKVFMADKDAIVRPASVAYRHTEDTMIVGCYSRCDFLIYKFTHG